MRYQMKGLSRLNIYGYVESAIKFKIKKLAKEHDCSMRLIINTALADALDIKAEDKFYEEAIQVSKSSKRNRTKKR